MAIKCPSCRADNPADTFYCGRCGTSLAVVGRPSVSVTRTLETTTNELARGTLFAGRYEIIEELGAGGMGRVYRAHDTKLKEEVALKLIKPEIAVGRRVIERFQNEIRIARKITHKNVCRMHDLHEYGRTLYLTMEYVRGEDLKSFIHRSKALTIGASASIARQVAEGLKEAHQLGITHRDLKPSNIMIDTDGNAKIMDFGIARVRQERGVTGEGAIIGTPEYMSPEQVEGKEADPGSDIYALGAILFEMLVGRAPFEGETPFSIANKHRTEPPPVPRKLVPQIPEGLSKLVLRCLEKDKTKRYQSAEELVADLAIVEQALPVTDRIMSQAKTKTSHEITVKFRPRRLIVPIAVVLGLCAASIFIWHYVVPKPASRPLSGATGQPTLAILYFENKSGDKELDFWRSALPELLIADLAQSRYVRVISGDQMLTVLRRLGLADAQEYSSEDIQKIATRTRASHVLRGSLIKVGENFIIAAGLQAMGTEERSRTLRLEARGENDIILKVDELTRQVKEELDLTATQLSHDIEKEAGKITTSSPRALRYYIDGRGHHGRLEYGQAIADMEKAVEIDPGFAMAFRSMASSHKILGHQAEAHKCLEKALEMSDRLPENERLLIEAQQLSWDENYAKEISILEGLVKTYPGYLGGHDLLAIAYYSTGQYDKAIEHYEFEFQSQKTARAVGNLVGAYMAKGFYGRAEDVCRSFLQDVEDNAWIRYCLSCDYLCWRQFDAALAEAGRAFLLDPSYKDLPGWVLLCKDDIGGAARTLDGNYYVLLARGKFEENVRLRQRHRENMKGNIFEPEAYSSMAQSLEKAGRYEESLEAFNHYLALSAEYRKSATESYLSYPPSRQKIDLFTNGRIQAETRSFVEAMKTADELKVLIDKGINKKELRFYEYILGIVELGKKNTQKAADLLERACGRLDCEDDSDLDHALFFDALARALYEVGDLNRARKEYEKITLLTMGRLGHGDIYAKAFYRLGRIAEQQRDKRRARDNYQKFLDLWKDADPGLPEVDDARNRLAGLTGS
jgi:serine/threonine protein kinase/tetratricopeptide (TPR) repeat protein